MANNRFSALLSSDSEGESESESHPTGSIQAQTDEVMRDSSESPRGNPIDVNDSSASNNRQEGGLITQRYLSEAGYQLNQSTGEIHIDLGFTTEELEICCKVISKIGQNMELFRLPSLKPLRAALYPLIQEQMKNYNGAEEMKGNKKKRKRRNDDTDDREQLLDELEKKYINRTQLRALRLQQLEKLNEDQDIAVPRIPDGVALLTNDTTQSLSSSSATIGLLTNNDSSNGVLTVVNSATGSSSSTAAASIPATEFIRTLRTPLACYICHKPFVQLHFFYSQLCPDCAVFNYKKRHEMADLTGRICVVTGGRTKIGYQSALKLLRCGAFVIVTTRFPYDCTQRYCKENDWKSWCHRLKVYALDFRDLKIVEEFCCYLDRNYSHIDAIVNNAAQTVRRPASYYSHLLPGERNAANLIAGRLSEGTSATGATATGVPSQEEADVVDVMRNNAMFWTKTVPQSLALLDNPTATGETVTNMPPQRQQQVRQPYEMSQMMVVAGEDSLLNSESFPQGATDINGQQVDLRQHNSWTMRLHEVSTPELAEVFAINSIAPTIINARLKDALERSPFKYRFIVNVSAMEGKFYRYKKDTHPHTNMAKAALNMMTRTSAQDYVKSAIYMTCVDTGWINDEKPIELAVKHQQSADFQTPIDEIDACSRVLDPIIGPLATGEDIEPPFGVFLKDYVKSEW